MQNDSDVLTTTVDRLLTFERQLLQYFIKSIYFLSSQLCHLLHLHESSHVQLFFRHLTLCADLTTAEALAHDIGVYLASTKSNIQSDNGHHQQIILDYIAFTEQFKRSITSIKLVFGLFDTMKLKFPHQRSSDASLQSNASSSTTEEPILTPTVSSTSLIHDNLEILCIKRLQQRLGFLEIYNQPEGRRSTTPSPTAPSRGGTNMSTMSSMSSNSTFISSGSISSDLDILATLVDLLNDPLPNYDTLIDKLVDNDHLLYQGFKLFFPKGLFLQTSSLFYLLIPYLQQQNKQHYGSFIEILTNFESLLPPYFDIEFPQLANEQLIYDMTLDYARVFPPSTKAFKLSIIKELMFNPESILDRDEYYENSILRAIISKENNDRPQSFDELSLKVIDIMEYIMFYLDSLKVILKIFNKVRLTLSFKSEILSLEAHLYDDAQQQLASKLELTNETLAQELDLIIQGGTKGLSQWPAIPYAIETLKQLHGYIQEVHVGFQWTIDRLPKEYPQPGSILLKDEHHFLKVVDNFIKRFGGLIELLEQEIIGTIDKLPEEQEDDESINNNHKIFIITSFIELRTFLELDSMLKGEFFQRINLFSFRFVFEDLITKLLHTNNEEFVIQ